MIVFSSSLSLLVSCPVLFSMWFSCLHLQLWICVCFLYFEVLSLRISFGVLILLSVFNVSLCFIGDFLCSVVHFLLLWTLLPFKTFNIYIVVFPFCVLEVETRALHMLGKHCASVLHSPLWYIFFHFLFLST